MNKDDKEEILGKKTKRISLIYLIVIIIICIIIGIFIGAFTPLIDFFDNMFGNKIIGEVSNKNLIDNIKITSYNVKNKELVYITNNNKETVYGINIYAMFYDNQDRPIDTEITSMFFIEPGKTVATLIECYDEERNLTEYAECVLDLQFEVESTYIKDTFQPLIGDNDKINISDVKIIKDDFLTYIKYNVENKSESKCASLATVAVFYKNGVPVYAAEEIISSLVPNKSKEVSVFPSLSLDFDEVKVYLKEAYKYYYQ